MNRAYYVEAKVTPQMLLRIHQANYKAKRYIWKISLISIIEIIIGIGAIYAYGEINLLSGYLFFLAAVSPVFVIAVRDVRSRHLKKLSSSEAISAGAADDEDEDDDSERSGMIRISFFHNHFRSVCDNGDIELPYASLMMIRELSDCYVLYVNSDTFLYVPRDSFTEGEESSFAEFLKKHFNKDYKKVLI